MEYVHKQHTIHLKLASPLVIFVDSDTTRQRRSAKKIKITSYRDETGSKVHIKNTPQNHS